MNLINLEINRCVGWGRSLESGSRTSPQSKFVVVMQSVDLYLSRGGDTDWAIGHCRGQVVQSGVAGYESPSAKPPCRNRTTIKMGRGNHAQIGRTVKSRQLTLVSNPPRYPQYPQSRSPNEPTPAQCPPLLDQLQKAVSGSSLPDG